MLLMTNKDIIINDIAQYIKYQIEEGNTDTEISQKTMNKLSNQDTPKMTEKESHPQPPITPAATKPIEKSTPTSVPVTPAPVTPVPTTTTPKAPEKDTTTTPFATASSCSNMDEMAALISVCTSCSLCKIRTNTVPGQGNTKPEIMFIGEAPGAKEDEQGLPFVGRSGNFLEKMIVAMGYSREEVFIGNILKCRPPENRKPTAEEIETCIPYLKQQIAILKPKVIIALGSTSVKGLLGKTPAITKLRGEWQTFEGLPLMPTFHPAYILRNQSKKGELWADLKKVLAFLGKTPPPIKKS